MSLADFGLSTKLTDSVDIAKQCGTPGYIDPEVLNGKKSSSASDIFSLGCLFYFLLTKTHLYEGKSNEQTLMLNKKSPKILNYNDFGDLISEECFDMLVSMIQKS